MGDDDSDIWEKKIMIPIRAKAGPYLVKVKIINKHGVLVTRSFINVGEVEDLDAATEELASNIEKADPEAQAEFLKIAMTKKPATDVEKMSNKDKEAYEKKRKEYRTKCTHIMK